jgi:hypothetical protein
MIPRPPTNVPSQEPEQVGISIATKAPEAVAGHDAKAADQSNKVLIGPDGTYRLKKSYSEAMDMLSKEQERILQAVKWVCQQKWENKTKPLPMEDEEELRAELYALKARLEDNQEFRTRLRLRQNERNGEDSSSNRNLAQGLMRTKRRMMERAQRLFY